MRRARRSPRGGCRRAPELREEAALAEPVGLVDDVGERAGEEVTATLDERGERGRALVAQEVEQRRDRERVPVVDALGRHDVDLHVPSVQRPVPALHDLEVVEHVRRVVGGLDGPPVLPVEHQRDAGVASAGGKGRQRGELPAEGHGLAPGARVGAGVRQHRGVELLGARPGLPPLEEEDPSAPRPIACALRAAIWPGAFGAFDGRQLRAFVACSMRIHGTSGFSDRTRSRWNAAAGTTRGRSDRDRRRRSRGRGARPTARSSPA